MTHEEAIAILERKTTIPGDGYTYEQICEAIDAAIAALSMNHVVDTTNMEPLTLEQLDGMDGQPH